jgi:transcriptional regulator with XRE-family HTH domain
MSFGRLLREYMVAAGLTQKELAESAGASVRSVNDLERGVNRSARRDTARLLADGMGLEGPERAEFEANRGRRRTRHAWQDAAPWGGPQ